MSITPNLFLVGAPKCGTTTVYDFLKKHPDIFFPELKEPHFLADDLHLINGSYAKTFTAYRELYAGNSGERYIGDASVFYLYSKEAAKNIHFFNPNAKIICMLRNPIEMMRSMFEFCVRHGAENVGDFAKALELELIRKKGQSIPPSVFIAEMLLYREITDFYPQVKRYLDLFPKEQVLILFFDDLKKDRAAFNQKILDFLHLENKIQEQHNYVNKTADVGFDPSKVLNRKYPGIMRNMRILIPRPIRERIQNLKKMYQMPVITWPNDAYFLGLQQEMKERILPLEEITQRDLSRWY